MDATWTKARKFTAFFSFSLLILLRHFVDEVRTATRAWPQLEYFCRGCLLRLASGRAHGWSARSFAFLDEGYEERLRGCEQIDRMRDGTVEGGAG